MIVKELKDVLADFTNIWINTGPDQYNIARLHPDYNAYDNAQIKEIIISDKNSIVIEVEPNA